MPAKDRIHDIVKRALIADGWLISAEQPQIRIAPDAQLFGFIDILAEQLISAERAGAKIAVEIKSFLGDSPTKEFTEAVGQYQTYQAWLEESDPEREIWLAVSTHTHEDILSDIGAQRVIQRFALRILVVDLTPERIVAWHK
jgi:XisH protein